MYTTSNESREAPMREKLMEHLEPLFVQNRVTLALWGHVHTYERSCPLNNLTCGGTSLDGGFTAHVVIGMAGQDWQSNWLPRAYYPADPIYPQPERSMYRGTEFGYTRWFATKEKLTLSFVGNHDGEVHDMIEVLASGLVLNGEGSSDFDESKVQSSAIYPSREQVDSSAESIFLRYFKVAGLLVLGALSGYIVGYLVHSRQKKATPQT